MKFSEQYKSRAYPALDFGEGNFHEISFDGVIVLILPRYNFFANGHRQCSFCNISENENFSVLKKMQTERSGERKKISSLIQTPGSVLS